MHCSGLLRAIAVYFVLRSAFGNVEFTGFAEPLMLMDNGIRIYGKDSYKFVVSVGLT